MTIEPDPKHADFAQRAFEEGGVASCVEIRREKALDALPRLAQAFGPSSFDLLFFDALKTEYPEYFALAHPPEQSGVEARGVHGGGALRVMLPATRFRAADSPRRVGADARNGPSATDS